MNQLQIRSEQLVINVILNDSSVVHDIMSSVSVDFFSHGIHKVIFQSILSLYAIQEPINLISVCSEIKKKKSIHSNDALNECSKIYSMFSHIERHDVSTAIKFLTYENVRHEHIDFAKKIEELSASDDYDPIKVSEVIQAHILDDKFKAISNKKDKNNKELIEELDKKMYEASTQGGINGITTGYQRFDKITSGMQPTNFIIVAARPAMGKTQLALGIMRHASITNKHKGLFVSCEMDDVQVMKRIISVDSGISGYAIKRGTLTPSERGRYERSRRRIVDSNLKIVAGSFTITELLSIIYKMKYSEGLDYVVIDYIQKVTSPGAQNRTNEVGDVSRKLKDMANDLKIPVIALAQLSRAVEHRIDKKPMLSDLRESGDIEQDADIVTFLYRNSYYMSPEERDASIIADDGYLIVAKHRDGELEDIQLKFDTRIPAWRNPGDTDDEYIDNYVQTQLKPNIDF